MIDKDLLPVLRQKCFVWNKPLWKRDGLPGQRVEELLHKWLVSLFNLVAEHHAEIVIQCFDDFSRYSG